MADLVPLQDLLTFTRDGEWGKGEAAHDLVKMAVIRGTDFSAVRHGNVSLVPVRYIPKKAADRKMLRPGDILIETAGGTKDQPTGRTVYLNQRVFDALEMPVTCASFARFLRVNAEVVDPKYLFWYLQSIYATGEMFPYHIQHTGVARFQYTDFAAQWRVPVPDKDRQLAIAEILGSLDDKIELNRRMNDTLEAMAQAIFRDWFVDFGPTRRKIDGATDPVEIMGGVVTDADRARQLADLFPARLGDDGLPDGWRKGTLGDVARAAGTSVLPTQIAPDTPYIGLEHMPRRSIALAEWEAASKVSSNKSAFCRGQILFGKLRPYFHKVGIAPVDGVCSTDIIVLDAINEHARSLIIACVSTDEFVAFTDQASTGTKMPRTSWGNMKKYQIALATDAVVGSYSAIASPLMDKIVAAIHENRTLAATRDLLLPKLMSGEIRLRDAEREIEAVA